MKSENQKWGSLFRVAIVGAATLKGKELKEVLEDRNFPAMDIKLLYPSGESEMVVSVPRFDFNWQLVYYEQKPKAYVSA